MGKQGTGDGGSTYFALESERARLENALLLEKQEHRSSAMELNALLDRPLKTPIEPVQLPDPALPSESVEALLQRALQNGPTVVQALREEQAAQARLKRARLSFAPDFAIMYDWMKDQEGMTGSEKGISASLPLWWNRPRGELSEARSALSSAHHSARAMGIELERAVITRFDEVETRLKVLRNIETVLIPSARSAFNIERARFESGRGDVALFLETFRGVLMAEMEYQRVLEEFADQWGALEQEVGGPVVLAKEINR
jgi:outer membrane protein TolC